MLIFCIRWTLEKQSVGGIKRFNITSKSSSGGLFFAVFWLVEVNIPKVYHLRIVDVSKLLEGFWEKLFRTFSDLSKENIPFPKEYISGVSSFGIFAIPHKCFSESFRKFSKQLFCKIPSVAGYWLRGSFI